MDMRQTRLPFDGPWKSCCLGLSGKVHQHQNWSVRSRPDKAIRLWLRHNAPFRVATSETTILTFCNSTTFAPSMGNLLNETIPAMMECRKRGWCKALGLTGYPLEAQHQSRQCHSNLTRLISVISDDRAKNQCWQRRVLLSHFAFSKVFSLRVIRVVQQQELSSIF